MQYPRNYTLTPELRAQLEQLIPEAFQDGQLNVDVLKAIMGEDESTENHKEHFELSWVGKRQARKLAAKAPIGALVPAVGEGINEENTKNIFIEGENLEVLRLLRQAYKGKVKMIYIDPPYNTGNDFVYKDNFAENKAEYLDKTGENLVSNPKSQGRFHANWLNFMYPRLRIARDLLREDGVIFISIDDNEVTNLRLLMNEVFGEENYIQEIVWQRHSGGGNDSRYFAVDHEYILCFSKNLPSIQKLRLPLEEKDIAQFKYQDKYFDSLGPYKTKSFLRMRPDDPRPGLQYIIKCPDNSEIFNEWKWEESSFLKALNEDKVIIRKDVKGKWVVEYKLYLNAEEGEEKQKVPRSLFLDEARNSQGKQTLTKVLGKANVFNNPKPIELLKMLINLGSTHNLEDIILDFFGGSGSTSQAVLELNQENNGNRRFICVQIPEKTDEKSEAYKAGYKVISDITKERIRRVIAQMQAGNESNAAKEIEKAPDLFQSEEPEIEYGALETEENKKKTDLPKDIDLGFKVFKLTDTNIRAWLPQTELNTIQQELDFYAESPFNDQATDAGIRTEIMMNEGFPLHTHQEKLGSFKENSIWCCYSEYVPYKLYICLDKLLSANTQKQMAAFLTEKDLFVCIDAAFGASNDGAKLALGEKCQLRTL